MSVEIVEIAKRRAAIALERAAIVCLNDHFREEVAQALREGEAERAAIDKERAAISRRKAELEEMESDLKKKDTWLQEKEIMVKTAENEVAKNVELGGGEGGGGGGGEGEGGDAGDGAKCSNVE